MRLSLRRLILASAISVACLVPRLDAQSSADLSILLDGAPNPVNPGGTVTYSITVNNKGPDDAATVVVDDPLPAGTTFQSIAEPAGWSCSTPAVGSGGTVSCSAATLPVGSAFFTLAVQVSAGTAPGTVIENTATVSSATLDPSPGSESATAFTTVGSTTAGLTVAIADSPDPVVAGSDVAYTITVSSTLADGMNAVLTLPPPADTTVQSLSAPPGWNCPTTQECRIAVLPTGDSVFVLTVRVAADAGPTVMDTASIAAETDGRTYVATDSEDTGVTGVAAVSATKTVTGTLGAGRPVTYTIVLTNSGGGAQADNPGDELTDVLPPQLTLVSASATSGVAVANVGTNTVTWNGEIPAGGSVTITIQTVVAAGPQVTSITNQGSFVYDSDANGTNDAAGVTDDPGVAGNADPTVLRVIIDGVEVPTLDVLGVALLTALLAVAGAARLRRVEPPVLPRRGGDGGDATARPGTARSRTSHLRA